MDMGSLCGESTEKTPVSEEVMIVSNDEGACKKDMV